MDSLPGVTFSLPAGGRLQLLPSGAAWCPQTGLLMVADLHLGKDRSFRAHGIPVPDGPDGESLARLTLDLQQVRPAGVIWLGDFLHSRHSQPALHRFAQWRAGWDLPMTLVRGNHDRHAGDPLADGVGLQTVDEPYRVGPWALCHHPTAHAGAYVLAGHWHPCVALSGKGRERLRLPCFWMGATVGVLPAYGAFTGMHPIEARRGDRVYAVAGDRVLAVPTARPGAAGPVASSGPSTQEIP